MTPKQVNLCTRLKRLGFRQGNQLVKTCNGLIFINYPKLNDSESCFKV